MAHTRHISLAIERISNESVRKRIDSSLGPVLRDIDKYIRGEDCELTKKDLENGLKTAISMSCSNSEIAEISRMLIKLFDDVSHPSANFIVNSYGATQNKTENAVTTKTQPIKPNPISGFPEFPPEIQLHLDGLLDKLKKLFYSHGFVSIDTPVVERLEVLVAKGGDVDKEIYSLKRARSEDNDLSDSNLALRYDLTVPFARYVASHFSSLIFPFKRFHIGSCWRGERPQDGRYRQFTQADIDIVNPERVPLSFDADIPLIMDEALQIMGIDDYVFRISNRKILKGYLSGLGVENGRDVTRILDKIDKIGGEKVVELLMSDAGLKRDIAARIVKIADISTLDNSFIKQVRSLGVNNSILDEGITELDYVMKRLKHSGSKNFSVDLSITRGFDYYTGSVYEVRWNKYPQIGSIAAGGRYDDLASSYIRKKLPGVGMSVGISRIYGKLVQTGSIKIQKKTATDVLVAWETEAEELIHHTANRLRRRGLNVEAYYNSDKISKQVAYARKKGIPYVIFPVIGEIKDMRKNTQTPLNMDTFVF